MTAVNFYEDITGNPAKFKQLNCKGLLFAHYTCPQVDLKKEFFSQHNFISYTLSGNKRIHKSGKRWDLESGVAIFAKKGAYVFENFENIEHCVMMFFIPDSCLEQLIKEYRTEISISNGEKPESIVKLDLTATTRAFFESMISYFNEPPVEHILELKFKELFLNLITNPRNKDLITLLNRFHGDGKPPLLEIMNDNYLYNLTLEDFAKISLRSLPTFKREFSMEFKTTPGKWLLQKRLENANHLIQTTTRSVAEIAFESGFENNTHFSRVFKERFGKSPLQYRKEAVTPA